MKKVAVIVTEYRYNSHADVILGRLLGDFSYEPRVQVVSIYTDQVPHNDMSREAAARLGIPIYPTIRDTIRNEQGSGPVDGVVIIGEHGDYPDNEKGQRMYPRRRMLEETIAALDELQMTVPIFSDKHFSYDFQDALWMYHQLQKRGIPFMGGSSIPHTDLIPAFDLRMLHSVKEIVVISHSPLVEAYGFHALEVLQYLAEQREGGETGVRSVNVVRGNEVWAMLDRKEWPKDLLDRGLAAYPELAQVDVRQAEPSPILMFIEYTDGTKGYVIQFKSLVEQWGFAFRNGQGEIVAGRCNSQLDRPFNHFERLTLMIEDLIISGQAPFPMERTLLTTGLTCSVVDSYHYGIHLETPQLDISYKPSTNN